MTLNKTLPPVTGVADPESLFTSPAPKLHANKQVVLHIVRDLLEANHWDGATIAAPTAAPAGR